MDSGVWGAGQHGSGGMSCHDRRRHHFGISNISVLHRAPMKPMVDARADHHAQAIPVPMPRTIVVEAHRAKDEKDARDPDLGKRRHQLTSVARGPWHSPLTASRIRIASSGRSPSAFTCAIHASSSASIMRATPYPCAPCREWARMTDRASGSRVIT